MDTIRLVADVALLTALAIVGYLLKNYLPSYFGEKGKNLATKEDISEITEKIESVRTQYSSAIERLRVDLRRNAFEHETRFSKLHERRVQAIDGLYKRLVRTIAAFYPLMTRGNGEESGEIKQKAGEAGQEFTTFFGENRLYLDAELAQDVGRLQMVLNEAWVTFAYDLRDEQAPVPQHERERRLAVWRRARDIVRDEAPMLRDRIEARMRSMLESSPTLPASPNSTGAA